MADETETIQGAWRAGRRMVMRRGAELPDRCVKTNQPAEGAWAEIRLSWHPPVYYLLVLLGLIPYLIVAPRVSASVIVRMGITERALRSSRRAWVISVALFAGASALWVVAVFASMVMLLYAGAALMVVALPLYFLRARLVWPTRVAGHYVWIAGVHTDYLADLPEWKG
jgi:hypothetical protein